MRTMLMLASLVLVLTPNPARAQDAATPMSDFIWDLEQLEKKIVGLAREMPEAAFAWRPGEGVRSTQETLMHLAADNYFIPAIAGFAPPAATEINGKDYKTTVAFEKRAVTRDEAIQEVEKSFAFLKATLKDFPQAKLETPLQVFGQEMTHRRLWFMAVTHVHEHLGQLIAYARTNKVVPPWSR